MVSPNHKTEFRGSSPRIEPNESVSKTPSNLDAVTENQLKSADIRSAIPHERSPIEDGIAMTTS
jgi:hypothetical protein